jgi:Protein of unknown function (DUF3037)
MGYHYSVLRFVPDTARGEFVNLGVLAGNDEARDWNLRMLSNPIRVKAIDDQGALPGAFAFVDRLLDHIQALDGLPDESPDAMSLALLWRMQQSMQNIVQFTTPAPVVARSSEEALDILCADLLVDPAQRRFRFKKKTWAATLMREAYQMHELPRETVAERVEVVSGPYREQFDFVVHNGQVVQMVQCWSFQLPNQSDLADRVKAWAWTVHELKENGGRLLVGDIEKEIAAGQSPIGAVYVPPEGDQPTHVFEEALAAFQETDVTAVSEDDVAVLADQAAAALGVGA